MGSVRPLKPLLSSMAVQVLQTLKGDAAVDTAPPGPSWARLALWPSVGAEAANPFGQGWVLQPLLWGRLGFGPLTGPVGAVTAASEQEDDCAAAANPSGGAAMGPASTPVGPAMTGL